MKTLPVALSLAILFPLALTVRAEDAPAPAPEPPAPAEPAPAPADAPGAAKKPADASAARWILGFSHGPLRRVMVDDGSGKETSHYYMRMSVKNGTAFARDWRPFVTLKVDTRPAAYVAGGFASALEGIRRQEGESSLAGIDTTGWKTGEEGKIAPGATKEVVAIFGPLDPGWAKARIEVNGLVNPITTVKVLKYGDQQVYLEAAYSARNEKIMSELKAAAKASGSEVPRPTAEYHVVRERRVRAIEYARDGDEFRPDDDLIRFIREDWEVLGNPETIGAPIPAGGK